MSQKTTQIGIIFDLDGTLLDSSDFFLRDIPKKIADYYGVDFSPLKQEKLASLFFDVFSGQKGAGKFLVVKVMWDVAKNFGIPFYKRFKFLKITHNIYHQGLSDIPLIKNVENTLNILSEKYDIKMGINTTGTYAEVLERFKGRMEFLDRFSDSSIITRDRVKNLKPSSEGILKLSNKWGIPPNHLIMVGDMDSDIGAGKNAGSITIGVTSGFFTLDMMEKLSPDFIFTDVNQIPENMEKILKKMDYN